MFGNGKWKCGAFSPLAKRARNRARRGVTAVEFALVAPVFFLSLMGTFELCLMLGAQEMMENAAFNTSRIIKTGYAASGVSQAQTVSNTLTSELQSYGTLIDTSQLVITSMAYNSFAAAAGASNTFTTPPPPNYGAPQQIVVYTITYPWQLFTPLMSGIIGTGGIVNLTSSIVVRNEPY